MSQLAGDSSVPGLRRQRVLLAAEGNPRLDRSRLERLQAALAECQGHALLTLEGQDGSFCEGLDFAAGVPACGPGAGKPSDREVAGALDLFARTLDAIQAAPVPVVALIDGPALGGGLGIAAAADLVLATPRARFGLPEALFGLIPAMVMPHVIARIGLPRTRLLGMAATTIAAAEAREWGLVDEVTEDLERSLAGWTRRFSRVDPRAIASLKSLLARHYVPPSGYREGARAQFLGLFESDATRARLARFLAGETPWPEGTS